MFKYELGEQLKLKPSEESGVVVGRAEYLFGENLYYIRYKSGDGRAVESWWGESAVEQPVK